MRTIFYLLSGIPHAPYLAASLWTLRKHWRGPIQLYAWPESVEIAKKLYNDDRLGISQLIEAEPTYRKKDGVGHNSQFIHKIEIAGQIAADAVLYLDADTTVHGDLTPLFDMTIDHSFVATQWNDWMSTSGIAHKRVLGLSEIDESFKPWVKLATSSPWPSVNGGVWACRPYSPVLQKWHDWTLRCKDIFISDERVLHLMQPLFYPTGDMVTVTAGGRYNSSPKFRSSKIKDEDVVVWHFHGDSNVRPENKSQKGYDLWWPIFEECLRENIGGIADWWDKVGNKWITKLKELKG